MIHDALSAASVAPLQRIGDMYRLLIISLLLIGVSSPLPVSGQDVRRNSIEFLIGYSLGTSSRNYRSTLQLVGDLVIARRYPSGVNTVPVLALDLGAQVPGGAHTDVCYTDPEEPSGCVQHYPTFLSLGALGGIETSGASLRAVAGPAYVYARLGGRDNEAAHTLGLQARAHVARGPVMVSVRGTFVPRYRGDSFWMIGGQIGFRARWSPE